MGNFEKFSGEMQAHFKEMVKDQRHLFIADIDPEILWEHYLESFPEGTNEIYRKKREHDCSCCRSFIKHFGGIVIINDNYSLTTIWDFMPEDPTYRAVCEGMVNLVMEQTIQDIYIHNIPSIGVPVTHCLPEEGDQEVISFNHFYLEIPARFIAGGLSKDFASRRSYYRTNKETLERSIDRISIHSINSILELIDSNSLYRGEQWKSQLETFKTVIRDFQAFELDEEWRKDHYLWVMSVKHGAVLSKIKNHSIGVLLQDITDGMELDRAVKRYEDIVAGPNYKRPKPIYTKAMREKAQKKLEEMGFMGSLQRRHAIIEDISINNVLFANSDVRPKMSDNPFDQLANGDKPTSLKFNRMEEIGSKDFIESVLPGCTDVELYLENRHLSNLVSLIAPDDPEAKSMFKWGNSFSWVYKGNITDSIKENVKNAGGNVEGVLRFSIQWNDGDDYNPDDLDAHCIEPNKNEIFFENKRKIHPSSGMLDVDIIHPDPGVPAVENIAYAHISKMPNGEYKFFVHCYSSRGAKSGFKAQIAFEDQSFDFVYDKPLRQSENVHVASVFYKKGEGFTIKKYLDDVYSKRTEWGITTNQFQPVSMIMFSPNYWDGKTEVGTRHLFFMLKDCINPDEPSGFFNEFLTNELIEERKVLEALSNLMRVKFDPYQLSGVGFSTSKRNSVVARIKGNIDREIKILF